MFSLLLTWGLLDAQAILDSSHTRTVRQCDWSPNGYMLATASFDSTIGMWENVGGEYSFIASFEVKFSFDSKNLLRT